MMRRENEHLLEIIENLIISKNALVFFEGPDECHQVSEKRIDAIEDSIFDLQLIYEARVKALKRK